MEFLFIYFPLFEMGRPGDDNLRERAEEPPPPYGACGGDGRRMMAVLLPLLPLLLCFLFSYFVFFILDQLHLGLKTGSSSVF